MPSKLKAKRLNRKAEIALEAAEILIKGLSKTDQVKVVSELTERLGLAKKTRQKLAKTVSKSAKEINFVAPGEFRLLRTVEKMEAFTIKGLSAEGKVPNTPKMWDRANHLLELGFLEVISKKGETVQGRIRVFKITPLGCTKMREIEKYLALNQIDPETTRGSIPIQL